MIVAFYSDMHGLGDLARPCFHPTLSRQWGRDSTERKILSRNFSRAVRRDSIYRSFLISLSRKNRDSLLPSAWAMHRRTSPFVRPWPSKIWHRVALPCDGHEQTSRRLMIRHGNTLRKRQPNFSRHIAAGRSRCSSGGSGFRGWFDRGLAD